MPIPFLSSINLTKNEVENFKIYNLANDPGTLTSGGDFGYFWLNTSSQKTLKWWDGANVRSIVDSTNIGSYTSGLATDLAGGAGGYLPYQAGTNDTTFLPLGTAAQILAVNSGITGPEWINQSSMSVGSATTATTANAVANALTAGSYLTSGGTYNGSVARTFAVDATDANTASKVVARDASGNFSAGTITAAKVTGLSAPTAGSDAANRDYVDSVAQGLDVKASCKAATVSNINLASPGATIDTVSLSVDNRVLVKDQSAPAENGIYLWKGAAVAMVRSPDADTWDDLVGAFTFIEEGTAANADSGWVCTVNAGGTLGSTAVTWVKFSQAGSYTAGNGIVQSGTSFNFAQSAAYTAGQIPFASSTTAMGFNANLHWDNANNRLGIGTATPRVSLDVASGEIYSSGQITWGGSSPTANQGFLSYTGGNAAIGSVGATALLLYTNSSERLRIASDGVCTWSNVGGVVSNAMVLNGTGLGVGVSPSYKLDVAGTINSTASTATGYNLVFRTSGITTGRAQTGLTNTSGDLYTGIEGSTAGQTLSGSAAYSAFIGTFTANPLYLVTNGSIRQTIDSSGNVGIGIAPSYKLDVAAAGAILASAPFSVARITGANAVANDLTLSGPNTSQVRINFGDPENSGVGEIGYNHASNLMRFVVNNGQVHTLEPSGVFTWYDGAGGTRMALNATGLGVGAVPSGYKLQVENASADCNARFKSDTANVGLALDYSNSYGFSVLRKAGSDKWIYGVVNESSATPGFRLQAGDGSVPLYVQYAGNVGISTTTPSYKLDVNGSINATTTAGISITSSSNSTLTFKSAGSATPFYYFLDSSRNLIWQDNATERMTLSSSGNLGLGVTPSAWATLRPVEIGTLGNSVAGYIGDAGVYLMSNAYLSASGWKYALDSKLATRYSGEAGIHKWQNAPSSGAGGAGTALTWQDRMVLDASGRLMVNTVTPYAFVTAKQSASYDALTLDSDSATTYTIQNFRINGVQKAQIFCDYADGSMVYRTNTSGSSLSFGTNNAERLRIKSTGQVNFVGQASDPAGAAGDLYYNSGSNLFRVYDTGWKTLPRKYSTALAGTSTTFDVTHNLGTQDVTVMVRKSASTFDVVYTDIQVATTNKVTIVFASSVTGSDYTVTVIG